MTLVSTGKKNKQGDDVLKPACVIAYNQGKKGVDLSDGDTSNGGVLLSFTQWFEVGP